MIYTPRALCSTLLCSLGLRLSEGGGGVGGEIRKGRGEVERDNGREGKGDKEDEGGGREEEEL